MKNSLFWHVNSRFVLKITETPVFMFSLLTFDVISNGRSIFNVVQRLCYCFFLLLFELWMAKLESPQRLLL